MLRSRSQSSDLAEFELFNVNTLRDVLVKAVGVPADVGRWGSRVSGGDSLVAGAIDGFDALLDFCRAVEEASARVDFRTHFGWVEHIQPVADPSVVAQLEELVIHALRSGSEANLGLAPPEIVDWDRVARFQFHFDASRARGVAPVLHIDLRLRDFLAGLAARNREHDLKVTSLRSRKITAVDADGSAVAAWPVWQCLFGELKLDGDTFVLDEGEFFHVEHDYMAQLDQDVASLPEGTVSLPEARRTLAEATYNEDTCSRDANMLLLDRALVRMPNRSTPIELCDILTTSRQLVHVKRHLGSSDLSHLFAQGVVSAELLQSSPEFRGQARALIAERDAVNQFDIIPETSFASSDYAVVYAIIAPWAGRAREVALPFFSKINLREAAQNLRSRGFQVALERVEESA
jgi:uncharacterized protein (TIGR04141 family)